MPLGTPFYQIEWTNCYQITMLQSYRSQLVVNRFFYQCAEAYVGAIQTVAETFAQYWNTFLPPIQSQEIAYDECRVVELFGERQGYNLVITGQNGSQAGAELPAFFGMRFTLTGQNTRVKKGRKIISGILEEMVEIDDIAAAYVNDADDVATFFGALLPSEGQNFYPALLSPWNTRHASDIITLVTSVAVSGWSTQSSRKIGRGA